VWQHARCDIKELTCDLINFILK